MTTNFFHLYKKLRDEVDNLCDSLLQKHQSFMQCHEGCSMCCQSFKILPVEFHAIQEELMGRDIQINQNTKPGECKFLINNRCSIYKRRPVICRTHGFPLARLNEDEEAYEIFYCELNFIKFSLDKFNNKNVYFEEENSVKLFELNKEFIKHFKQKKYDSLELLKVNELKVR